MGAFSLFSEGDGGGKKEGALFKCKCNKQHYCELYTEEMVFDSIPFKVALVKYKLTYLLHRTNNQQR